MNDEALVDHLQRMRSLDPVWFEQLEDRKKKELEFHDRHRDRAIGAEALAQDTYEKLYGNKKFYTVTDLSRDYVSQWIQSQVSGKIFLDYACGNGMSAIAAARYGARLSIGVDISPVSVENAMRDAKAAGVEKTTFFVQGDAENTGLPSESIDVVLCSGMLHHLDLSFAFPELRRLLAPGGRILAVEALDYNPVIKAYRMLTPGMRTEWEKAHILDMNDVRFAQRFFDLGEIRYWHIASIAAAYFPGLLSSLNTVDNLLTKVPVIKYLSWMFTFELLRR